MLVEASQLPPVVHERNISSLNIYGRTFSPLSRLPTHVHAGKFKSRSSHSTPGDKAKTSSTFVLLSFYRASAPKRGRERERDTFEDRDQEKVGGGAPTDPVFEYGVGLLSF